MTTPDKFRHCMVFAGGGFQFGIYLGMHAAACEVGKAPDIVLATCGGALAAQIICALPDQKQRQDWLESEALWQFWCGFKSSKRASITGTLLGVAKRKFARQPAAVIPDIFEDYLFEIPPRLHLPPVQSTPNPALVIVGAQALFDERLVGQPRGQRKLFRETVFCDSRAAALLKGATSVYADPSWGEHAIDHAIALDTTTPADVAARISIGDMLYFRCLQYGGENYVGGLIDLFPVELAQRLSDCVSMEHKSAFDQNLAIPMFRSFMGFDANRRLRETNRAVIDYRIDTSDVDVVMAKQAITKKIDWRRNQIRIEMPSTHAAYVADIRTQWQYGYDRAMQAYRAPARQAQPKIRLVSKDA